MKRPWQVFHGFQGYGGGPVGGGVAIEQWQYGPNEQWKAGSSNQQPSVRRRIEYEFSNTKQFSPRGYVTHDHTTFGPIPAFAPPDGRWWRNAGTQVNFSGNFDVCPGFLTPKPPKDLPPADMVPVKDENVVEEEEEEEINRDPKQVCCHYAHFKNCDPDYAGFTSPCDFEHVASYQSALKWHKARNIAFSCNKKEGKCKRNHERYDPYAEE